MGITARIRNEWYRRRPYKPAEYWEHRAHDFTDGQDDPSTWASRGWLSRGRDLEHDVVPRLLRDSGARTVLVAGAGSGDQYDYLDGFEVRGFDISPTLVATCLERYPDISTVLGDVVGCDQRQQPADAIIASGVLQHIEPHNIASAVASLMALTPVIVHRDMVRLEVASKYQFIHDYDRLFEGWEPIYRETADETDLFRTELVAWAHG